MIDYKKEYVKLVEKYKKLHDKLYERDVFEVEHAGEFTSDSRQFKNGLCVYNKRLNMVYSVTEVVELLNMYTFMNKNFHDVRDSIIDLFDEKIESLENKGLPSSILHDEIKELELLRNEIVELMEKRMDVMCFDE